MEANKQTAEEYLKAYTLDGYQSISISIARRYGELVRQETMAGLRLANDGWILINDDYSNLPNSEQRFVMKNEEGVIYLDDELPFDRLEFTIQGKFTHYKLI